MALTLHLHPYDLALRHTFRIAHGSRDIQPTVIVELRDGNLSGFGEAAAIRYYGQHQPEMMARLESWRSLIEQTPLTTPEAYWEALYPTMHQHPFLLCALDEAAHDLHARRLGQPLYKLWNLEYTGKPLSNYTIGIGSVEEMVAKMEAMPWPIYKIKLGTDDDMGLVRALRQHTDALFRVDANTAWTVEQTLEYAPELKALGVEFIEQPLKPDDWSGQKRLLAECPLPVIADESCQLESDVARCAGHFHGINIKLMKCGGITPARRMIAEARHHGMQVMIGCMMESSVGISAIAQLVPLLDYVDMDGAILLSNDPATGVCLDQGIVHYPLLPGTGVALRS